MMDAGPLRALLTVVAGVLTGVLSAAFGVGGAVISTPAIRVLGVSAMFAVGTTLPSILPSAVSGTLRYARESLVRWDVVAWAGPAGAAAAVAGSLLSRVVPGEGHGLMIATAALLALTAARMARGGAPPAVEEDVDAAGAGAGAAGATGAGGAGADGLPNDRTPSAAREAGAGAPAPPPGRRHHGEDTRPAVLVAIGAVAGLMSGLLGLGGGVVTVPGFSEVARLPLKAAIATSLACVGIFAVPGTLAHWSLGNIDWATAGLLSLGVVPGARLGAVATLRAADRRLRLAVAGFLGLVALVYAAGELVALMGG